MTNSSLKPDPNQLNLYVHPWYEALKAQENTIRCELESTLKQSEDSIGLKSIEWAAGLYEGEGFLTLRKDTNRWRIAIQMTDYDVLKKFHAIVDCGKLYGPWKAPSRPAHYKPSWTWQTVDVSEIFNIICEFYPHVGERRRAKFDEFLTHHYGN